MKKANLTGQGKIQPKDIALNIGETVYASDLFPTQPPYHLLRVEILGNTVGADLVAVRVGTSTLVFYDTEDTEVGRCTVTVLANHWWQTLPDFLQLLLRWFAFGWLWMG